MRSRNFKQFLIIGLLVCVIVSGLLLCYELYYSLCFASNRKINKFEYNRHMPLIFIGGMPRSGTTLLRVLLDAHPDIRCGQETRLIPRMLALRHSWMEEPLESRRLLEAGITPQVLDSAVGAFILELIVRHGSPATRLCDKDPFTLRSAVYLANIFPNSKFIFMIRDGRAVVHSIISRKVTIFGFNLTDFRQCFEKWNSEMSTMHKQCKLLGTSKCLPVHYEQLVLQPKYWMEKILRFLEVLWNDSVLRHEEYVNKDGGISLSELEYSTDQVIKPINIEALSKWVGKIPNEILRDINKIAPMLSILGYDPSANPPDYGKPDAFVIDNMQKIERNKDEWLAKQQEMIKMRDTIQSSLTKHNSNNNDVTIK